MQKALREALDRANSKPDYLVPGCSDVREIAKFAELNKVISAVFVPNIRVDEKGISLEYPASKLFTVGANGKLEFPNPIDPTNTQTPLTADSDPRSRPLTTKDKATVSMVLLDLARLEAEQLVSRGNTYSKPEAIQWLVQYGLLSQKNAAAILKHSGVSPRLKRPTSDTRKKTERKTSLPSPDADEGVTRRQFLRIVALLSAAAGVGYVGRKSLLKKKVGEVLDPAFVEPVVVAPAPPEAVAAPVLPEAQTGLTHEQIMNVEITAAEKAMLWNPAVLVGPYKGVYGEGKDYQITQGLHDRQYGAAIDVKAGAGSTVYSSINGLVIRNHPNGEGTTTLIIRNSMYQLKLMHGNYTVNVGDMITAGQPVGTESNLGNVKDGYGKKCVPGTDCGNHTHINIVKLDKDVSIDPTNIIKEVQPPDYERLKIAKYQVIYEYFPKTVTYWIREIFQWADKYGVDPLLLTIIMTMESVGFPKAISRSLAQGLFQVMPFHFYDLPLSNPFAGIKHEDIIRMQKHMQDPHVNAEKGAKYIKAGMVKANGDVGRAMAGYNGGHGIIDKEDKYWHQEARNYRDWGTAMWAEAVGLANGIPVPTNSVVNKWGPSQNPNSISYQAAKWQRETEEAKNEGHTN